jgi:hypothetical protein
MRQAREVGLLDLERSHCKDWHLAVYAKGFFQFWLIWQLETMKYG